MKACLLLLPLCTGLLRVGQAQRPDTAAHRFCFGGAPQSVCTGFVILETGYAVRLTSPGQFLGIGPVNLSINGGLMANVAPRVAIGGAVLLNMTGDLSTGVMARLRYWATPTTAIDLSPGLLLTAGSQGRRRPFVDAGVMFNDRVGFNVQAIDASAEVSEGEFPNYSYRLVHKAVIYTGLRLGTRNGVKGLLIDAGLAVAFGILLLSICGTGACD